MLVPGSLMRAPLPLHAGGDTVAVAVLVVSYECLGSVPS